MQVEQQQMERGSLLAGLYRPRLAIGVTQPPPPPSASSASPESPSSGYGSNSEEATRARRLLSPGGSSGAKATSAVLSVSTVIKTERSTTSPPATSRRSTGGGSERLPVSSPSPTSPPPQPPPPSPSAAMHPISLSLLHSPHTAPGSLANPFYSSAGASASSPSPLKRSRHHNHQHHLLSNNNGPPSNHSSTSNSNNNNNNMEDWLPSPGQMSVDSMSPQPPVRPEGGGGGGPGPASVSGSSAQLANALSSASVISSSGYSPSPMSTGSYEPAFSPGGASKLGREDLSPPGSVNGGNNYSVDSFGDAKKKKGPVPRQQEELCLVCGDRASGYHYNALTCEGCKGFFRRSITKNAVYQCKYGNSCDIDMYMRRKCQECRLKKCLTVGMRPECVVPEYQCAVKREAKKAQKEKDRPPSSAIGSPESKDVDVKLPQHQQQQQHLHQPMQQQQHMKVSRDSFAPAADSRRSAHHRQALDDKSTMSSNASSGGGTNGLVIKPLSPEQEELINRLVYFQEEFDQPSEEDLRKISTSGMHESDSEAKFKHITEMTILTVQLTVEFSKRLPGFDTLLREDQITLLKACSSEVMMLRCARRYDANTDSIVFANNLPYTRDSYNLAGVGDTADPLFRFGKQMSVMKVDNAEYALLTAIVIFSERPGLVEARKVEKIQEIYLEALQAYVMNHRVRPMTEFAKLLSVLTELRTLGNLNSEMCFSLKLKNKKLPPFLAEIWDVHS